MKALTIKQPWASLIVGDCKDIENRSWWTGIRGRVAIHSSARIEKVEIADACSVMQEFIPKFSTRIFTAEALWYPTGVILGTVEIVDCVSQSDSPWFFGPFGFVLRNPQKFASPIPARGSLGFWEWDAPTGVAA